MALIGMAELARICDYVVAGEQFVIDLGWDGKDESFAAIASSIGAPVVTVPCGVRGSLTWTERGGIRQPAFPVPVIDTTYTMILGRVLRFHIRSDLLRPNGQIDALRLRPVARLSGDEYATLGSVFEMKRPP